MKAKVEEERRKRNADLLDRWKAGESTTLVPTEETWFPKRPAIKKDPKLVAKLFDKDPESQ